MKSGAYNTLVAIFAMLIIVVLAVIIMFVSATISTWLRNRRPRYMNKPTPRVTHYARGRNETNPPSGGKAA